MARAARTLRLVGLVLSLHLLLAWLPGGKADVEAAGDDDFAYWGDRGPEHWGDLKEEWKTCGSGQRQSPIDIISNTALPNPDLGSLRTTYHPANAVLRNRGYDVAVLWPHADAGNLEIGGVKYTLLQCHWHHPAEHTLDGQVYPLELHAVHQAEDGKIAVVGIIYELGKPDYFLTRLRDDMTAMAEDALPEQHLGAVNPADIKVEHGEEYYRYDGSLTTPPCDEGVIWTVIKRVRTATKEQIDLLQRARNQGPHAPNARPVQPINGRTVELYARHNIHGIFKSDESRPFSTF